MESFNGSVISDVDNDDSSSTFVTFVWYLSLSCICVLFTILIIAVGRLIQLGMNHIISIF